MLASVCSATLIGIEARPVEIQADVSVSTGAPAFNIAGLPEMSVRDTRVRVRSALRSAHMPLPGRVVVAAGPADLRKDGTSLDLPLALVILQAAEKIQPDALADVLVVGELGLTGVLRPVCGILAMAQTAKSLGKRAILCPFENSAEAGQVADLQVLPAHNLHDVIECLAGDLPWPAPLQAADIPPRHTLDWSDVRAQPAVKRALEIAAAGGHNVLLLGPAGSGKTMLARRLPTIMAPMSPAEMQEATKLYSAVGMLPPGGGLVRERPFRAPHHTCSASALMGGGSSPKPGEVSLASGGVLLLDEIAEFPRHVLECLREPLEARMVTVTRARQTAKFPAHTLIVGAAAACPCGGKGSGARRCTCTPQALERYNARLSGPFFDKFDLRVSVPALSIMAARNSPEGETSEVVRARVTKAQQAQIARYGEVDGRPRGVNARVAADVLAKTSPLSAEASATLSAAHVRNPDGAFLWKVWRVARTIADLAGAPDIAPEHMVEAIALVAPEPVPETTALVAPQPEAGNA